jgi:hypothetical protein
VYPLAATPHLRPNLDRFTLDGNNQQFEVQVLIEVRSLTQSAAREGLSKGMFWKPDHRLAVLPEVTLVEGEPRQIMAGLLG